MIDFKSPKLIKIQGDVQQTGHLRFLEHSEQLPFEIRRVFWITNVPENGIRGVHAHREEVQILVALQGVLQVILENKKGELFNFKLDQPGQGLVLPAMHWSEVIFQQDAILLGLGNCKFSESDYIRDKQAYDQI
ncbi:sugar 3,4-ketoisomerase [Belliella pelovolcani]|uniref:sugar 3,4-ketoisomerase n=1 Tax=Belliella pelovolcani TaxID=529505 RepID=UPI00391898E5